MNQKQNYKAGVRAGLAAVKYAEVAPSDQKEVNCDCESSETICADCLSYAAWESESNARCYSPFEFFAADCNRDENRSEGLWASYEAGIEAGIKKGLRARLATKEVPISDFLKLLPPGSLIGKSPLF